MATDVTKTTQGNKVVAYLNDVKAEMVKVVWPDQQTLKDSTIRILIFVLLIGAVIALIDVFMQTVLVRGIPSLFSGR